MTDSLNQNPFDAKEYEWLVGFEGDWRDSWWHSDYLELIAKRFELSKVRSMLDVGCGVGHWGQNIAKHIAPDATIHGVDREEKFISKAAARCAERLGRDGDYRQAEVETLPFADNSFDLVTCQTVLMHVRDPSVALSEMVRVLAPSGLLLAAEPNNLASSVAQYMGHPQIDWAEMGELLGFEHTCQVGKLRLGQGDSSVGERLPGLFAQSGLTNVRIYSNDKCASLIPPYETADEKMDLRQHFAWIDDNICLAGGGPQGHAKELFVAGGGEPNEFERLWDRAMAYQRRFKQAVLDGECHRSGGFLFYLVGGRKP